VADVVRYLETFYRHRKLFAIPVLVGLVISVGLSFIQPQTATATARIWYDLATPIAQSNAGTNPYGTPADLQAQVLMELVNTRAFGAQVADRGPLGAYLRTQDGYYAAEDSMTAAKSRLKSLLGGSPPTVNSSQTADLAYGLISKNTTALAVGPQIVLVTFSLGDAKVASGTLQAIVDQYSDIVLGDRKTQAQAAVDFWQQQVNQQRDTVNKSDGAVTQYLSDHPDLARSTAVPDSALTNLKNTQELDRQRYASVLANLDQAKLSLSASTAPAASGFRVIDPPQAVSAPSGLRKQLLLWVGGLAVGLLISVAGVVAMTLLDPTLRREEDVVLALGLRVIGSIPRLDGLARHDEFAKKAPSAT
jgi:uncharacterized protein involved in exopolysaccharide biosynthesis